MKEKSVQIVTLIYQLLMFLMGAYIYVILAYCILSMLIGFGIFSAENRFAIAIFEVMARLVEPALAPIRAILPQTGMMDFSPLVLLLSLQLLFPYLLSGIYHHLFALYGAS